MTPPLQRRVRELRYRTGIERCVDTLARLGVDVPSEAPLELGEADALMGRFVERVRANAATALRLPASEAHEVARRLDRLAFGDAFWLAASERVYVAIRVPSAPLLSGAVDVLVTRAEDLRLTTRDASSGLCVELNHYASGDEYEIVTWGELTLDGLPEILVRSRSSSWSERAAAAAQLADHRGAEALQALRRLLNDPYDTAVTEAALDALIARGDPDSAAMIFAAVDSDDADLSEHLALFISRRRERLSDSAFLAHTREAAAHSAGAREVLGFIGP